MHSTNIVLLKSLLDPHPRIDYKQIKKSKGNCKSGRWEIYTERYCISPELF